MIKWLKILFHFHSYEHVEFINQWYESRSTESLQISKCGKRRVKCDYWDGGGTEYFYHKGAYPRYL